jgi:hypothetical protein
VWARTGNAQIGDVGRGIAGVTAPDGHRSFSNSCPRLRSIREPAVCGPWRDAGVVTASACARALRIGGVSSTERPRAGSVARLIPHIAGELRLQHGDRPPD